MRSAGISAERRSNDGQGGLVTLALLKTRYDEKRDQFGLLEPFVLDALSTNRNGGITTPEIQNLISTRSHLTVPLAPLGSVLKRLKRSRLVTQDGDRFRASGLIPRDSIESQRGRIAAEIGTLGTALRDFAEEIGSPLQDDEAALSLLTDFIAQNKVPLVLSEPLTVSPWDTRPKRERRAARMCARFIRERCMPSEGLRAALNSLLEGMILKDTLTLGDIQRGPERFRNLTVFLDTPFLIDLLDLAGTAGAVAAREGLSLMREAGARAVVFHRTVGELRGILEGVARAIRTVSGYLSLPPTELTRHVQSSGMKPSDLIVLSKTIENRLAALGIAIEEFPKHNPKYTLDEESLAKALADPTTRDTSEPRVVHDVECIAAVMTLRKNRVATRVESSVAIFCTSSRRVVRSVQEWYATQGVGGVPPIVHQYSLSSIAWIKRPSAAPGVKLYELAAVCAALLRPPRATWDKLVENVLRLRDDGGLSDDLAIAIVADELTEPLLEEAEEGAEGGPVVYQDVIDKVRNSYKEEYETASQVAVRDARAEVALAQLAATEAHREKSEIEASLDRLCNGLGRSVGVLVWFLLAALILVGTVLAALDAFGLWKGASPFSLLGLVLTGAFVLSALGMTHGVSVASIAAAAEKRTSAFARRMVVGKARVRSTVEAERADSGKSPRE